MKQSGEVTQETLDSAQYSSSSILQYEAVYGENFVSPGGSDLAAELIGTLDLAPDSRVLDVGCGLGGSAFVMARRFSLYVDGIDLSKNMLAMANKKLAAHGLSDRISLEWGDCLELDRAGYYDAVYSRDVFLHIHDKKRLFSVLNASLRPAGQLLFSDYCCGQKPWSEEFSAYVEDRGYCLHTLADYAKLIAEAGFEQVEYQDLTGRFIDILHSDLDRIAGLDTDESVKQHLQESWRQKLARAQAGDHRWGLFTAIKGVGDRDGR
ncbi:MAG: methyltransferase domain-containing protein [Gammaproteobacteria bacterium]